MLNPLDLIHGLCSNLDPDLVERHEPSLSVIVLRVSGTGDGTPPATDLAERLRERLIPAFAHLAQGQFLEAQAAAAAGGHGAAPVDRGLNGDSVGGLRATTGLV